jgi:hypothetical protein
MSDADLAVAAEEPGALAKRLLAPLDSAVRLMLLDALSAAADEIPRVSVEVRARTSVGDVVIRRP